MQFRNYQDCTTILLDEPYRCPACHSAHYVYVNAGGRTVCIACYNKATSKPVNAHAATALG